MFLYRLNLIYIFTIVHIDLLYQKGSVRLTLFDKKMLRIYNALNEKTEPKN